MKLYSLLSLALLLTCTTASAQNKPTKTPNQYSPQSVTQSIAVEKFDVSLPLRLMAPKAIVALPKRGKHITDLGILYTLNSSDESIIKNDLSLQSQLGIFNIPAATASFQALTNRAGVSPPDANGDVGITHIVVMSNLSFQILNKSGVSVFGPAANNTLWSGFGGDCETDNSGDPVVLYDQIANRWLLSQFTSSGPEYYNCVALSTTSDPTGSYYRWAISNGEKFPDYPKYGIWTDGYYITTRDIVNSNYVGVGVYALKREDLLTGNPNPAIVYRFEQRSPDAWRVGDGLLPADIDGFNLPPMNAPQYFIGTMDDGAYYGATQDALSLWKYHVDFETPANSTFILTDVLSSSAFDSIFPCGKSRECIPQKNTANKIDIQSYRQRPLHRLAYRNFGTHESLVVNQSVEASVGVAGIKWWEVRNPSTVAYIHQQGTYAPGVDDGIHRWMGSIAMDRNGNMALAYSASGADLYPSIRYTGRIESDPLGSMTLGEGSIVEGLGSQTSSKRWGDYTSLTVDPVDDCTFWHINQYYQQSSSSGWVLRAGAFRFDECGEPGFFLRAYLQEQDICAGDAVNYLLNVRSIADFNSPVSLTSSNTLNMTTTALSNNPVNALPGSSVLSLINTGALKNGSYLIEVTGSALGTENKSIALGLNVFESSPALPVLTLPLDTAQNIEIKPSLNWKSDNSSNHVIELAKDKQFTNIVFTSNLTENTVVPFDDLEFNTQYYWRVKAINACGKGDFSAVFGFKTVQAIGMCSDGFAAANHYSYGFENGLNGWNTDAFIGFNTWVNSSVSTHSGEKSMLVTDVDQVSDQFITSPLLQLPINQAPLTLQFWNKQSIESRNNGCFDGTLLEISTDQGQTFSQISSADLLTDPYDGSISFSFSNPLAGEQAWCGDPQDWLNSVVNINKYAGQEVVFRFRIVTDSGTGRQGWFIDDVKVQSCVLLANDVIYTNGFE